MRMMRRPLEFVAIGREKTIKRVANYNEGGRPGCAIDRFKKHLFWNWDLGCDFFSLGPIETTFRKYTFHKNRFFLSPPAKNEQKMAKNDQNKFWPKNFGFLL